MSSSRNDIFSTSWQSADSLVPAPPPSDLARRRTTGPAWRRPRTIPPRVDEIFKPDSSSPQHPAPLGLHRGGSLREPPVLRLETTELAEYPTPQTSSTSSRTSSFFDVSPTSGLYSSTRSVSTSLTGSSTNPSLAASLPSTPPLAPVQLKFTPRPDLQLGQGRFSCVYLAAYREHQPKSDWRVCVVKRLEPDDDSRALGLREAWFLRQLAHDRASHPGQEYITRLLGVQVEDEASSGFLFERYRKPVHAHARSVSDSTADRLSVSNRPRTLLLLEYYPLTLSALPARHLCPRTYLTLATQLSQALAYCHSQHILHTDVKPANVLLATYPSLSVRLADFGSSLHLPSLPTTPSDPVGLGTLAYSPPEFFRPPPSEFSFPSDVFSAGVTLASALFNRAPYERIGIRECRRWVTRGAYWTYEEHKRADGEMPVGDRLEDAELMGVGKESFERVLGRICTPTELAGLIAPTGPSSTPTPPPLDVIPYSDGSAPVYFPHSSTRVPQDIIFLLKRMCEPIPEQRPTMDEVAHQFQALRLGL